MGLFATMHTVTVTVTIDNVNYSCPCKGVIAIDQKYSLCEACLQS